MFSRHVFILNASEDLTTPNLFPLPEGSAAAEVDTRGCGFVFVIARYLNSFVTNERF